jgi:hypothetical protein
MIKCSNIEDAEPGGAMVVVVVCCCLRRLLLFVAAHVGVGYCDAHTMRTGRHGSSCGLLFITTPLYVGKQYCDAPLMRTHPPVMKVGFFVVVQYRYNSFSCTYVAGHVGGAKHYCDAHSMRTHPSGASILTIQ